MLFKYSLQSLMSFLIFSTMLALVASSLTLYILLLMMLSLSLIFVFFFLNDPPTPEISPLPLPDALPICVGGGEQRGRPAVEDGLRRADHDDEVRVDELARDSHPRRAGRDPGELRVRGVVHLHPPVEAADRKSTRLNSSHLVISYAVFCLK